MSGIYENLQELASLGWLGGLIAVILWTIVTVFSAAVFYLPFHLIGAARDVRKIRKLLEAQNKEHKEAAI